MNIDSIDGAGRLALSRVRKNDWPSFRVDARIDLGHGTFAATNHDVAISNLAAFVAALDRYILDRSLRPRLEATYGTFVEVRTQGRAVLVEFRVGDEVAATTGNRDFGLTGTFEIDEGALTSLLAAARELVTGG